jgi:hypothetical protein
MECRDAQFYLRFRRPGSDDLDPADAAALGRHLAACPPCAADARFVTAFDAAVASAMRAVPVPTGLRTRLIAATSAQRGATLRRRAYRGLALAASVLLTAGLALGVFTATRPHPETYALAMKGDELAKVMQQGFQVPVGRPADDRTDPHLASANEAAVRKWLAAEGLPAALPEDFDYGLLLSYHWEGVQGRKVPVVWFRERGGPGFAKVYVFRATQFNLKGVAEAQASHCQAMPLRSPDPSVAYVVVFTSQPGPAGQQPLAPFLIHHGGHVALKV